MITATARTAVRALLSLRYRIRVTGIEQIAARGSRSILFLPNHPALIDPIIVGTVLHRRFRARFLADRDEVDRPVVSALADRIGVLRMPDLAKRGPSAKAEVEAAVNEMIASLRRGDNFVLYPAGHIYRGYLEDLRGNSGVERILDAVPEVRVALVRTRGLWGSGFSRVSGRAPDVAATLRRGARSLLLSGLFFAPRREVTIELREPADFPRTGGRDAINAYLQAFYNENAPRALYVPSTPWERGGCRELPEPGAAGGDFDLSTVPPATRQIVIDHLAQVSGVRTITEETHLAHDLGMDSLARAELLVWVGKEFGQSTGDTDSVLTAGDVMRAACGQAAASGPAPVKLPPAAWFRPSGERAQLPEGATLAEVFLNQAARGPGRLIAADAAAGARSYRDLLTGIFALRGRIARLEGDSVGIMLPASVGADALYLATVFAGKTPVMVNWTVGLRNMRHALDLAGVRRILTADLLLQRLKAQGIEFGDLAERFVPVERLRQELGPFEKLAAFLKARLAWGELRRARISPTAAVLFTSGSESLPKAVPLTHANMLANMRDVLRTVDVRAGDRMIGFLPPFHSFGLSDTTALPLCLGVPVVHYPNPTEGATLARLIEGYGVTLLIGTPTFLNGIVRAAQPGQLRTLRLAVTGAEKCPERVYAALAAACPGATVLEGYGITECSPIVSVNSDRAPKPFTIGRVMPSLEYAVLDLDRDVRVERGAQGMLLVRGPSVFGGYLKHDGPPPFVEFEGKSWYRTGDLVREDADGVLTFCGRLKRFVKLGGEMVSLPAIEAALEKHYVTEQDKGPVIAVEATPSEEQPEVVLFTVRDVEREAVNRQIRDAGLSPLHNIRRVVRLDEIPVLGTGKTDYRALKERLRAN